MSPAVPATERPLAGATKAPPSEGRCRSCGGWVVTVPAGTPWARGRCGNRAVDGMPGRKCARYGQTQRFVFTVC